MISFVFFGTDQFAVKVLEELKTNQTLPVLIITTPGKNQRGVILPSPVESWAKENALPFSYELEPGSYDLLVVASYGKILPESLLAIPKYGVLNIHPSLLPKYRGPSPLQSTILNGDQETGVTIIQLDKEMDHGPVLITQNYLLKPDTSFTSLRDDLAKLGARLLIKVLPDYIAGNLIPVAQDHREANFTKKFTKADAEIKLDDSPTLNYRKVLALNPEPGTWLIDGGKRIKIISAHLDAGKLILDKVVPEGKREMSWTDYLRGLGL